MTKQASKYFRTFLLSLVVYCNFIISCSTTKDDTKSDQVFRYNEHKNISSLDPAFAKDNSDIWATNQLFNGLVQMDSTLSINPAIASSWIISEDGKTYTFNLREDVYFHPHKLFGKSNTR